MTPIRMLHGLRRATRQVAVLAITGLAACSGDDFDRAQVPVITITPVVAIPLVTFTWTPAGAQQLLVYKGTVADGNAANLVWSISGTNTNSLVSGIEYGANPPVVGTTLVTAKALIPGQPYTVQISRVDPSNASGSVSGSNFRYQSTQTFTLPTSLTPP